MILILFLIAGISNGFMDAIKFRSDVLVFKGAWWSTGSWTNKWRLNSLGGLIVQHRKLWYYGWYFTPKFVERFPYSSTVLVAWTNAWHFFQMLMLTSFKLAVCLLLPYNILLSYIALTLAYGIGFYFFYNKLLIKN
jgi:hypothetical protein